MKEINATMVTIIFARVLSSIATSPMFASNRPARRQTSATKSHRGIALVAGSPPPAQFHRRNAALGVAI